MLEKKKLKFLKLIFVTAMSLLLACTETKDEPDVFEAEIILENKNVQSGEKNDGISETEDSYLKQTEEEIIKEEPNSVELIMVGDVLLHTRVSDSGLQEDGSYQYDHLFEKVKGNFKSPA